MKKVDQKQSGGVGSNNTQIVTQNNYSGIGYKDAKAIAQDVFDENILKLSSSATESAKLRASEFNDSFLSLVKKENIPVDEFSDPSFQYTLFDAQLQSAKRGEKELDAILIDVLIERLKQRDHQLRKIVLEQSIKSISLLTPRQINSLSLIFILKYAATNTVGSFESLKKYLEQSVYPFSEQTSTDLSDYQHIEYSRCGKIELGSTKLAKVFKNSYQGLFAIGFEKSEFIDKVGELDKYNQIIIPCINDSSKLQIKALNKTVLQDAIKMFNLDKKENIISLYDRNTMNDGPLIDKLKEELGDNFIKLDDKWSSSPINKMSLTTVGMAVAIANIKKVSQQNIDLSIWIK